MSNREAALFSRFQREQSTIGPREADIAFASGFDTKPAIQGVDRRLHPHKLLVSVKSLCHYSIPSLHPKFTTAIRRFRLSRQQFAIPFSLLLLVIPLPLALLIHSRTTVSLNIYFTLPFTNNIFGLQDVICQPLLPLPLHHRLKTSQVSSRLLLVTISHPPPVRPPTN